MDEATREALSRTALVLEESDSGADPSPLAPLGDRLTDTRVVGLGTPTEASRESWAVQDRILRHLVAERGLRVVCLDAEFTAVETLDAYVTGDTDDLEPDLPQVRTSSLQSQAVFGSLQWLRRTNAERSAGDQVRLYGLGGRDPGSAADRLRSYLDRVDPAFLETVRHNFDVVARLDSPLERGVVTDAGDVVDRAAPAAETADRKAAIEEADRLLPSLRDRLTEHESAYTSRGGRAAWERAEQYVILLEQAVSLQRPLQQAASGTIEREEAVGRFCHLDALATADNLDRILAVADATSTAVLAPTTQVARDERAVGGSTAELLGSLLAARYGESYYALGSEVEPEPSGPAIEYGGGARGSDAPPSETVPEGLGSIDAPAVVLDFERARADDRLAAWLAGSELADAFDGYCVLPGSPESGTG